MLREAVNVLYLQVGGYNEILNMCYWDFQSVMETLSLQNRRASGKPVIKEGPLSRSTQDMISRRKNQR